MNWLSVIAALAVPVLSYVGGLLTFRYTKRDVRSRIEADIALLELIGRADTVGANRLRASIDERLWHLANSEQPRPFQRKIALMFGGSALMFVVGSAIAFSREAVTEGQFTLVSGLLAVGSIAYLITGIVLRRKSERRMSTLDFTWSPDLLVAPTPAPPHPAPAERPTLIQRLFRSRP